MVHKEKHVHLPTSPEVTVKFYCFWSRSADQKCNTNGIKSKKERIDKEKEAQRERKENTTKVKTVQVNKKKGQNICWQSSYLIKINNNSGVTP